jgi:hypothetical protein
MLDDTELNDISRLIDEGKLPADFIKRWQQNIKNAAFGVGYKTDRSGKPIEQGIGSPGNMTQSSIDAYKKFHKDDPDFERELALMERQLRECEERRRNEPKPDQRWLRHV